MYWLFGRFSSLSYALPLTPGSAEPISSTHARRRPFFLLQTKYPYPVVLGIVYFDRRQRRIERPVCGVYARLSSSL
ncbi:hypothetical protein JB92DRAFT_2855413 [Gautieria morchelliformis]|nr:hypothetical protein JB92DRAFT_2855413 [Gautieria morchelliformis]